MPSRIRSYKTIVKPATQEKSYPDKYIVGLGIQRDEEGKQPAVIALKPYNYETKEIYEGAEHTEFLKLGNIWTEAVRSTFFASTLNSLVDLIMLLYKERKLREKIFGTEDSPERQAAIIEFQEVQTQLGVEPEEIPPPTEPVIVYGKPDGFKG